MSIHWTYILDIKVKEPTLESLTRKKKEYMPPKFMTVNEAAHQLLEIVKNKKLKGDSDILGLMMRYYKLLINFKFVCS